jgi:hypothetical protein
MDFAAGVYLSDASSPPMTAYPPFLPHTHCINVYCTLFSTVIHTGKGGGGGGRFTREKVGGAT